ncbi:MAG: YdcF family protein [Rhizobiaceae bacterium]|nr:YdcF family protein [Rhizobiaceae bacterium]
MFFLLAKVIWFFLQPLNAAIVGGLFALVAFAFKWRRTGTVFLALSIGVLVLSTWTNLGAVLLQPLEDRYPRPPAPTQVAGIIVLGGGFEGAINLARGGYDLNAGGDRMVEAAILARRYPNARIVVSGGTGALLLDGEGDADTAPRLLEALGVGRERLILENKSRDTYENAQFTRKLVQPVEGETWLLLTSAFHMPRSMELFRKAGFQVTPWPVDYRTTGRERIGAATDNPVDTLRTTTLAIREWIGLVAYRIAGRTDRILP